MGRKRPIDGGVRAASRPGGEAPAAHDEGDALDGTFVPVRVVGDEVATEPVVDVGAAERLEVVVRGGRVIRVPDGFEPRTLARVVQTLEALVC